MKRSKSHRGAPATGRAARPRLPRARKAGEGALLSLSIRAARTKDFPALTGLLDALFSIEPDFLAFPDRQRQGLALLLSDPERCAVLVADRGGEIVGMVTAQLVVSTAEGGRSAWVEDMVVAPAERGRGVGRALLEAIERWAGARGAGRLQLLSDRENAPALAFYARLGWRRTRLVALRRGGTS